MKLNIFYVNPWFNGLWPVVLLLLEPNIIEAQNCGFPLAKVTLSPIEEDYKIGTVLENIRVVHVGKSKQLAHCDGGVESHSNGPFVEIETFKKDQNLRITLRQNPEELIDVHKFKQCIVKVKIPCTDGRRKEITLEFPLIDHNTKYPKFEPNSHDLEIQLPWNCNVFLNFNYEINISDSDRDLVNANISLAFNEKSILRADIQPFYIDDDNQAYVFPLHLYISEDYCQSFAMELSGRCEETSIRVFNEGVPELTKLMNIRLTFLTSAPRFDLPPNFQSHVYKIFLNYYAWKDGTAVLNVSASDPDKTSTILYSLEGGNEKHFDIDQRTGVISLKAIPPRELLNSLDHQVGIYTIQAFQEHQWDKSTNATLLVFFATPEFECTAEGKFRDPEFCNVFHTCTKFGDSYQDHPECCPYSDPDRGYLIFCERDNPLESRCEYREDAAEFGCICAVDWYNPGCDSQVTGSPIVTSTETSEPNPTTSDSGTSEPYSTSPEYETSTGTPGPFICSQEGSFGDPEFCNIFHQCVATGSGKNFTQYRRCCAYAGPSEYLDFCEKYKQCYFREEAEQKECACSHDNHDETCLLLPSSTEIPQTPESSSSSAGHTSPSSDAPQTTDSDTSTPEPIPSTPPPGEFNCEISGQFRDPVFCNVFYDCRDCLHNGCIKERMCCPLQLYYCEAVKRCVYGHESELCPCSPPEFGTCP